MKLVAGFLLVVVLAFVGAAFADQCENEDLGDCPPACHLACVDGCTLAPVEPLVPELVALEPTHESRSESDFSPLDLEFPPDLYPPRA